MILETNRVDCDPLVCRKSSALGAGRYGFCGLVLFFGLGAAFAAEPAALRPTKAAINDFLGLSASTVMSLDVDPTPGAPVAVRLRIDGVEYTVDFRPWSVRAEGYQVLAQVEGGGWVTAEPGPIRTLRGVVHGVDGSAAAGSMLEDGLHAVISFGTDDAVWLEPIGGRVPGAAPGDYVVYRSRDVVPTGATCGVTDVAEAARHRRGGAGQALGQAGAGGSPEGPGGCTAELACDADVEYFNTYGTVAATEARINSVINTVNLQYQSQTGITHLITTILVRTANPDPYTSTDPETRLCQFITEWTNNQGGIQRDVAHFFTGANINGGVIGIAADIGGTGICVNNGACNGGPFGTSGSYCMAQSDFNGNFSCATDLSAHELGHLWGAFHCSCPNNTMNPFITCANSFTAGSVNSITSYASTRTCLVGQCGGGGGGGDCCIANGTPGCGDPVCQAAICAVDPFCCNTTWDQICADQAATNPSCPCGGGGGPANDNCANASPIGDGGTPFDTNGATTDGPSHAECDFGFADGGAVLNDVWFDYTATCTGDLTVSTCNTASYDTKMAVYDGCACPPSPILGCNDDGPGCSGFTSELTVPVQAGNCYKVRIGGFNGATGTGTVNITCSSTQCTPPNCDDGNPCTTDVCNSGTCIHTANNFPCNDGDACTTGDVCSGGTCQPGTPLDCNDNNACTDDACVGGTCLHQNNTLPCEDGDPCTTGDACSGGACQPGTPMVCDDGNPCTADLCVGGNCVFQPIGGPCDDGNPCTLGDSCTNGQCLGTPVDCTDQNPCTDDFCDPAIGACVNAPNANPCDDGDVCTVNDVCSGGFCAPGAPANCDDNNVCTTDSCVGGACQHGNNALPCNDGDPCTENDTCGGGTCGGTPVVPCIPVDIRLTPAVSSNPNATIDLSDPLNPEIVIDPGDAVVIEAQVGNWDGDLSGAPRLRTIQVDLKTSSLTSGSAGALSVLDLDADNNGTCDAPAALCPICTGSDLGGVYIDTCRHRCGGPDGPPCDPGDVTTCGGAIDECLLPPAGFGFADFFPELPGSGAVTLATNPNTLVSIVTMKTGTGAIDDGLTHYSASYVLQAGSDARGTFTLEQFVEGDPASDIGGSFARSATSLPVLPINLGQVRITIAEGSCCAANGTCTPNVTRPECDAMNGFFRLGQDCPPPVGNGPACECPANLVCTEIRLTPVAGTGIGTSIDVTDPLDGEIVIDPGDAVLVEVQAVNWDDDLNGDPRLRTVQVDLKTSSLTSGAAGAMSVLDLDVDNNGSCDAAAALCPICTGSDLRGVYIDVCRHRCGSPSGAPCDPGDVTTCGGDIFACLAPPAGTGFADFFPELPGGGAVTQVSNPDTLVSVVTMKSGTGSFNDGEAHYVASYVLTTSTDARGTFLLEQFVEGDPNSDSGGSFARTDNSLPILPISLGQLRITIAEGSCCLPDGTCVPNVTRLECDALNGFFRPGDACPPPIGNGPPCGCTSDLDCDDLSLCTIEFCCGVLDAPVVPCNLDECVSKTVLAFGDVNNDVFANADDVNCLLDSIGGNVSSLACCDRFFGTCSGAGDTLPPADFQKRDLAPCPSPGDPNNMGDGFESADDVNAILDVIAGTVPSSLVAPACLACGVPTPEPPQTPWDRLVPAVDQATLTLVPTRRAIVAGGEVSVDVFTSAVDDLRTFQVAIDVSGGDRGRLDVTSVAVGANRKDFVFGGLQTVSTAGVVNRVMLATLPSGGVPVAKGGYLGTFVLRASADAAGAFTVLVRDDGGTLLRTSLDEVISVTGVPVSIDVRPVR